MNRKDTVPAATTEREYTAGCGQAGIGSVNKCVAASGAIRTGPADVLVVGGMETALRPVLLVLDGCGWSISYQSGAEAAATWLASHRALVAVVEVGHDWRSIVADLRLPLSPGLILLATDHIAADEAIRIGVHDVLFAPADSYHLLWSLVSAWQDARKLCA